MPSIPDVFEYAKGTSRPDSVKAVTVAKRANRMGYTLHLFSGSYDVRTESMPINNM